MPSTRVKTDSSPSRVRSNFRLEYQGSCGAWQPVPPQYVPQSTNATLQDFHDAMRKLVEANNTIRLVRIDSVEVVIETHAGVRWPEKMVHAAAA